MTKTILKTRLEMEAWKAEGPITGMYWLPAMDPVLEGELIDPDDRREAIRRRVKSLHRAMRGLYDVLGEDGTFFISGVRLGGYHGYDEDGATDIVGGAVAGYTKAFARERPDALVKTVDFEPSGKTAYLHESGKLGGVPSGAGRTRAGGTQNPKGKHDRKK